ncbi:putative UDP-rhamnose:rhamnosyltransferase 1 [Setaria viridis]|uniref:putative UDP-rhamnose:rhamnosyltransferase 1 n=1 Tax=Setaria viridis TaxID=4556 RepID=UPI003B3A572B
MAKKPAPPPLHVVVFPWLAFGHIVPFLDLAQQLARRGHFVTFLSTPRNVARIRPVPPELSPYIRFVSLPLPAVDGLRDGAEATSDVPPEKVDLLKIAFDGLAAPFAGFLTAACGEEAGEGHGRRPDWVVVDFAHHWLPPIADEHRVPCALFFIFPAAFVAFVGPKELNDAHPRTAAEHFMVPPPWIPPPSPIAYRRQEAEWIAGAFQPNASGVADSVRMLETVRRCALLVCRCSREVDGALCTLLDGIYGKPVVPSGLLAPYDAAAAASSSDAAGGGDDEETASLVRWLDAQPERSVIYVAFGSEAPLTPALVREIAQGLELAGVRFLWALRETSGGMLPDRFEARARAGGRGLVRVGWVPQVRVLAHAAVGGFFTHAGLSSLVDSFLFGHPLVMLPLFGDQGLTARLMAERRVGLEVPRDDRDGSVRREDVAAAVRRVMVEDEGEVFAGNARELREILWDTARQEEYIDELVEHLRRRQED